jgi:large exoprotein involved in heme utilization and adhesion
MPFPFGSTEVPSPSLGSFSISEQGTAGNGGNVTLEAKNKVSNLEILTLSSSSQSGTVQVTGLGDLLLTDTKIVTSKLVTVRTRFGNITLKVGETGQSGNVDVTSLGNLTFFNSSIQSDTKGIDNAGNVTISSPGLVRFNNSSITSNTSNTGAAGRINIEAGQGITLIGSNSGLFTIFAGTTNSGEAGDITLTTPQLTLQNGARISTNTASSSAAGAITLQSHPQMENLNINLTPGTSISASTSDQGTGGNIEINAPNAITIQGQGTITTDTTGTGAAGNLTIDTKRLTIADGATISASTSSNNPQGTGGSITINATESFNLTNQASLRAQSTGAAPAGKVTINTPNLTATNGTIATSSQSSSGGDITITADKIRLYGNSDITTLVAQGAGGGGNIKLTAGSIVAFDDSDILAYAPGGTGGNITLETPAFFGENYSPASSRNDPPATLDRNNRVDVNATGTVSSGVITIPDTTFIQNSLTELPSNQINTEQLLANSCIVRRNQPTRGSFTVTGTGGLPQRPGDAQMSSFPTVDVETLPSDSTSSTTQPNRPWQKGDPIVEPQGVYRLPNGKLVMSRECSRLQ